MILRRVTLTVAIISGILCLTAGAWFATYPSSDDPKSIQYTLWKMGFHDLDQARAAGDMVGDVNRDELVVGKTKEELRHRFVLQAPAQTTAYYRKCDAGPFLKNRSVLFIEDSEWLIIFTGDKATELVLCKGY
jgi:hypothetical protein